MNWFWKSKSQIQSIPELTTSILYDEGTFYNQFVKDLSEAKEEVIIECPYITKKRLDMLKPFFKRLVVKGVQIVIVTKSPKEHEEEMAQQSEAGIQYFEVLGPQVLLIKGGHHRKLAMIDRKILWEGSLNILSQFKSREFMRRIESRELTEELFRFLHLNTLGVFPKKLNLV